MSWPVVLASGGPRERGRAYGDTSASRIGRSVELYEAVFARYAGLRWTDVRDRAEAFVEPLEAYDVELLPEIEGIAEGAAVDAEDVLALDLRTEIMFGLDVRPERAAAKECTALGVADADEGPIVAQNWDWKPAVSETCVLLACAPHGRPGFVTFVEAGLLAKLGVNERGLAVATNALTSSLDRGDAGVPYHAILRRLLISSTTDEAIAAIRHAPRASSANYLIGSAAGDLVDIEAIPGGADGVRITSGTRLVHANHFTWPPPRGFGDVGRIDGEDSLARHAATEGAVAAGRVGVEEVKTVLRSHDNHPSSVCSHADPTVDPIEDYVTIASFVAALGTGRAWITQGNPCERPSEAIDTAALLRRAREVADATAATGR